LGFNEGNQEEEVEGKKSKMKIPGKKKVLKILKKTRKHFKKKKEKGDSSNRSDKQEEVVAEVK
jgi:hypothetical protein